MTLLLLGGTFEARALDVALAAQGRRAVFSMAEGARTPYVSQLPQRICGFGGKAGFRDYIREAGITAVLDVTHPFAIRITRRTARLCADLGLPYAQVLRPPWRAGPGDRWTLIDTESEAARHIPPGSRVFLATGRATLSGFANLRDCHLICRQLDPPEGPFPLPDGQFLLGDPPFSVEEELATFRAHRIDWLIVKNAGGEAPRSKLVAARQMGLPVILINRPAQPEALRLETVDAALRWVDSL